MGKKAQAGLEYLVTYGWALVLIATIVGAFAFLFSTPSSNVVFSSSNPAKMMVNGGSVSDGKALKAACRYSA